MLIRTKPVLSMRRSHKISNSSQEDNALILLREHNHKPSNKLKLEEIKR